MVDPESHGEVHHGEPLGLPSDADAISTVAMTPDTPPFAGEPPLGTADVSLGSSFSGVISAPAVVPTDKTVISKRTPVEPPFPVLPTPQSLGQALIGKTLDHYELVEFVGGGGMGAVFRAVDTRLGRTVAVKVLSRDHTDEETIRRFRNEAQSAARLDHPNIARVHFVGEAEGWNYIVFEFIEGTNLREIVDRDGPLPLEQALDYTLQVAEALDHASQRDVVHRDIKPSNVLVMPSGKAKLVDMGLARLHQVESSSEDLTASGVMLGTFDYISPEQARDPRSADVRSDIYSLGCTLYFMLTGRPPFPEGTAVQKLLKHNSEEPPDLRLFRPELPPQVTALVARMLAKRPAQRQQSPQELISEVLALGQQLGLTGLSRNAGVSIVVQPAAGSLWSRVLPIAVPVAALALLLLLIDSLSRQGEQNRDFVLRPVLSGGRADQPAITEPQTRGNDTQRAVVEKTGPVITKTSRANATQPNTTDPSDDAESESPAGGATADQEITRPMAGDSTTTSGPPPIGNVPEAAPGAASSIASPVEPDQPPQRIIVRSAGTELPMPQGAEIVYTLSRACQLATKHTLTKIELEFDGELTEKMPFSITLPRVEFVAAEKLEGGHYKPVIAFRPQPTSSDTNKQMIRLVGGSRSQVTFRGVELRLDLPEEPSSGWSLLALYQLQSLELSDSVLTVRCPGGTQGLVGYEPVAMLALQPLPQTEMMKMTEDMMAMQPSINVRMTNCIARGEATFLTAPQERPLNLSWRQGLLVTPRRMLDTGGYNLMKPSPQDRFEIELHNVTAIVSEGLARQNRAGMPSHLRLDVNCQDCVLQWDRAAALFEFRGFPIPGEMKLRYSGDNNLYMPQSIFLRQVADNGTDVLRVTFDQEEEIRAWGSDLSPDKLVWDPSPPSVADLPAHRHRPSHYRLQEGSDSGEGFDPKLLEALLPAEPATDDLGTEAEFFERPISP